MELQDLLNQIILLIPDNNTRQVTPQAVRAALRAVIDYTNERIVGIPFIESTFNDSTRIFDSRLIGKKVAFIYAPSENMMISDITHDPETDFLILNSGEKAEGDTVYVVFSREVGGVNNSIPHVTNIDILTDGEGNVITDGNGNMIAAYW